MLTSKAKLEIANSMDQPRLSDSQLLQRKEFFDEREKKRAELFRQTIEKDPIMRKKQQESLSSIPKAEEPSSKNQKVNSESFTNFIKKDLDLIYVNKLIKEMKQNSENYTDRAELLEDYKKLTMYCVKNLEGNGFLKQVQPEKKAEITREVNRVFDQKFEKSKEFKDYVQRMFTYKIEDLKREVKDNKWKIYMLFLTEALRQNPKNKDLLEKLKFKVVDLHEKLPDDLRHIVWRAALSNPAAEKEYSSLLLTDKVLTVSAFDMNILNETRNFVAKFVSESLFDTLMTQAMYPLLTQEDRPLVGREEDRRDPRRLPVPHLHPAAGGLRRAALDHLLPHRTDRLLLHAAGLRQVLRQKRRPASRGRRREGVRDRGQHARPPRPPRPGPQSKDRQAHERGEQQKEHDVLAAHPGSSTASSCSRSASPTSTSTRVCTSGTSSF